MLVSFCSASRIAYVVGCPYAGRWRAEWPSVRRVRQADTRNIRNSLGGGANVSAEKTYSRRLFVAYQELVEGSGRDLDGAVERYAVANKGTDLEQRLTFREWFAETGVKGLPVER